MTNDMLVMHHLAREARPTEAALSMLAERYPKGVRFRVNVYNVNLYNGVRTIYSPVIEVVQEIHGRMRWQPYMWPGDEL